MDANDILRNTIREYERQLEEIDLKRHSLMEAIEKIESVLTKKQGDGEERRVVSGDQAAKIVTEILATHENSISFGEVWDKFHQQGYGL